MDEIEGLLSKALAMVHNYRGPHRTKNQNGAMLEIGNKIADALGDIRFEKNRNADEAYPADKA